MKIKRFFDQKEKISSEGAVVVVDILRAATVEAFLLAKGTLFIFPVASVAEAFALKKQNPDFLLVGEEKGYPIKGFDYGNSPSVINQADFSGKIVVHRTSNGTRQLELVQSKTLLLGSLNTISATYRYIQNTGEPIVSLLGAEEEDQIFFDAFENLSSGKALEKEGLKNLLFDYAKNSYFWDESKPEFPKEDVILSAKVDLFDFACVVAKEQERLVTKKISS